MKRECLGEYCRGKLTIHETDPHHLCFRCRGPYHKHRECEFCSQVPQSTKSTWISRCENWIKVNPEAPPPPLKKVKANPLRVRPMKKLVKKRSFYHKNHRSPFVDSIEDIIPSEFPQYSTASDSPPVGKHLAYDQLNSDSSLLNEDEASEMDVNQGLPFFAPTIDSDTTAPVNLLSHHRLMNKILCENPVLLEQGGVNTLVPSFRYEAIRGPRISAPSFPLDNAFQVIANECMDKLLSNQICTRSLDKILKRYKVTDSHMRAFDVPVNNTHRVAYGLNPTPFFDKNDRDQVMDNVKTTYKCGAAGISLANHLLLISQHALNKLATVDMEEVGSCLQAMQSASEDLLSIFLSSHTTTVKNHRILALASTSLSSQKKQALMNIDPSKEGKLFGSDIEKLAYDICECENCHSSGKDYE